jgi:hypothetical protein
MRVNSGRDPAFSVGDPMQAGIPQGIRQLFTEERVALRFLFDQCRYGRRQIRHAQLRHSGAAPSRLKTCARRASTSEDPARRLADRTAPPPYIVTTSPAPMPTRSDNSTPSATSYSFSADCTARRQSSGGSVPRRSWQRFQRAQPSEPTEIKRGERMGQGSGGESAASHARAAAGSPKRSTLPARSGRCSNWPNRRCRSP